MSWRGGDGKKGWRKLVGDAGRCRGGGIGREGAGVGWKESGSDWIGLVSLIRERGMDGRVREDSAATAASTFTTVSDYTSASALVFTTAARLLQQALLLLLKRSIAVTSAIAFTIAAVGGA